MARKLTDEEAAQRIADLRAFAKQFHSGLSDEERLRVAINLLQQTRRCRNCGGWFDVSSLEETFCSEECEEKFERR